MSVVRVKPKTFVSDEEKSGSNTLQKRESVKLFD